MFCATPGAFANPVTYNCRRKQRNCGRDQEPGRDAAQNNCMACHSVDYIAIQPPKKGKAFWESEVNKMVQTYKAEIRPTTRRSSPTISPQRISEAAISLPVATSRCCFLDRKIPTASYAFNCLRWGRDAI